MEASDYGKNKVLQLIKQLENYQKNETQTIRATFSEPTVEFRVNRSVSKELEEIMRKSMERNQLGQRSAATSSYYEEAPRVQRISSFLCIAGNKTPKLIRKSYNNTEIRRTMSLNDVQSRPLPPIPTEDYGELSENKHFQDVTREEAVALLKLKPQGTFLLRKSQFYYCTLVVKTEVEVLNIPIKKLFGKYFLLGSKEQFSFLLELIKYYQNNLTTVSDSLLRITLSK